MVSESGGGDGLVQWGKQRIVGTLGERSREARGRRCRRRLWPVQLLLVCGVPSQGRSSQSTAGCSAAAGPVLTPAPHPSEAKPSSLCRVLPPQSSRRGCPVTSRVLGQELPCSLRRREGRRVSLWAKPWVQGNQTIPFFFLNQIALYEECLKITGVSFQIKIQKKIRDYSRLRLKKANQMCGIWTHEF